MREVFQELERITEEILAPEITEFELMLEDYPFSPQGHYIRLRLEGNFDSFVTKAESLHRLADWRGRFSEWVTAIKTNELRLRNLTSETRE